jgi:hypothetical protein
MDTDRVAALVRELARTPSRRAITRAFAGLGLGSILSPIIGPGTFQASGKGHGHGHSNNGNNNKKKKKKKQSPPPPLPTDCVSACGTGQYCCGDTCCYDDRGCSLVFGCCPLPQACLGATSNPSYHTCCPNADERCCPSEVWVAYCCSDDQICHPGTELLPSACCDPGLTPCRQAGNDFFECCASGEFCCGNRCSLTPC